MIGWGNLGMTTEGTYVKACITRLGDLAKGTLSTDLLLLFLFIFLFHIDETLFKCDREGDERIAWVVFINPAFDLW